MTFFAKISKEKTKNFLVASGLCYSHACVTYLYNVLLHDAFHLYINMLLFNQEILVYMRLVKYALKALDIYTIAVSSTGQPFVRPAYMANVKTKEEKEVLEHFAGVVSI